jgi:hypothetical protein
MPYQVQSAVSAEAFQVFVSGLEGGKQERAGFSWWGMGLSQGNFSISGLHFQATGGQEPLKGKRGCILKQMESRFGVNSFFSEGCVPKRVPDSRWSRFIPRSEKSCVMGDVGLGKPPSIERSQLKRTEGSLLRRKSKPPFCRGSSRWKNSWLGSVLSCGGIKF